MSIKGKQKKRTNPSEHHEQKCLFEWANLSKNKYKGIELMFAIPNGGLRNIITAVKLKREGVKAGVPDIFLPVAKGRYHGLFIEMKSKNGYLTENQKMWIDKLKNQGYQVYVCRGWQEAAVKIKEYFNENLDKKV